MDYERIEALSKKLHNARLDIRLRTASNLLFKLESGIFDKDAIAHSTCLTTLLDGVHKSLAFILDSLGELADHSKESYQLLQVLLSIVRVTVKDPARSVSLDVSSRILEQLYQLKNSGATDGQADRFIDETINTLCGLNRSETVMRTAQFDLDQRIAHMASTINVSTEQLPLEANQIIRRQGAGAVINSRLVYTGWKFPPFVLTERDERWLFDVEVKVKLQHERAARDLWDVLEDFPPQALLLKTNLLHSVLDLVGAPFSQADVDADPQGLHCLSALRWLETLLGKCRQAFRVQLDGSHCSHPPAPLDLHRGRGGASRGSENEVPDLAGKLAQEMYAMRHPSLPPQTGHSTTDAEDAVSAFRDALFNHHNQHNTPNVPPTPLAALSALFPGPSVPGLAFACCAASLPLLQARDNTLGRAVRSLLGAALPLLLEPRLQGSNGSSDSDRLLDVEHGRLQHLLNRIEQLLAFFGDTFDIDAFLALMSSDDDSLSGTEEHKQPAESSEISPTQALSDTTFDLTVLSTVVELFRQLPCSSLLPTTQPDDGLQGKLAVGPLTMSCLFKVAATSTSLEALLPGCTEVAARCLCVLDGAAYASIQAAARTLETARLFSVPVDRTRAPSDLLAEFLYATEASINLLDYNCPVPVPALQLSIASTLPILLLAAYQRCDDEDVHSEEALQSALALIVRVLTCGSTQAKSTFLGHLLAWLGRSYELLAPGEGALQQSGLFSEQQIVLIRCANIHPASARQMLSVLATPGVLHALLHCTTYTTTLPTGIEDTSVKDAAQEVIEALCAHLLHRPLTPEQMHAFSTLLLPLKVAEWEAEELGSGGVEGGMSSGGSRWVGITTFARQLQDACADSPHPALQTLFARSLVTGMFHTDSAVRINSALRVRRDLLHVPLPTTLLGSGGDGYGVMLYDLFPAGGALRLVTWKTDANSTASIGVDGALKKNKHAASTTASRLHTSTTPAFSHADVRKVASIGLGELDCSVRASALGQLLHMLSSDSQLLHTADADWCVRTVRTALTQLTHLAPFVDNEFSNCELNEKAESLQCSAPRLARMGDAECRLFLETARVVSFFLTHYSCLRGVVHFHASTNSSSGGVGVSVLLKLLLSAHLQKKSTGSTSTGIMNSTTSNTTSVGYDALQQVACVCAQTLAVLACCTEGWAVPASSSGTNTSAGGSVGVLYKYTADSASTSGVSAHSVHIPGHVMARFLFPCSLSLGNEYAVQYTSSNTPSSSAKDKTHKTGKIAAAIGLNSASAGSTSGGSVGGSGTSTSGVFEEVFLRCAPLAPVAYPPGETLVLLVSEAELRGARSVDRIQTLTATKLFGQVIGARDHVTLRAALSSTLAVLQACPALLHCMVALRISLVTAVSHIITVSPRTQRDHLTLSAVLDFLSAVFASLLHTTSTTNTTTTNSTSNNAASNGTVNISSPVFQTEVAAWFSDALLAVLPALSAYSAEHFPHANTHFVGLAVVHSGGGASGSGGYGGYNNINMSREALREHATSAHSVCTSYFRLLHCLTSLSHPAVQLSSTLLTTNNTNTNTSHSTASHTNSSVLSLLVHISSSELHGSRDRAVALAVLENVVALHSGGYVALCSIESPEYATLTGRYPNPSTNTSTGSTKHNTSGRGKGVNLAVHAAATEQFDVVACLVRVVKLVRTPDSLQSNAAVVGGLRLLYRCLVHCTSSGSGVGLSYTLRQSEVQWKWLVRLLYDRRAEVRVLALEVLAVVLRCVEAGDGGGVAGDASVDSLDHPAHSSTDAAEEGDTDVVDNNNSTLASVVSWPPFELLSHLAADSTESVTLRSRAVHLLVTSLLDQPALRPSLDAHFKLPVVVGALFDCMSLSAHDSPGACASSITSALSTLSLLLGARDEGIVQHTLTLVRTMKVLPLVVEVLNVRLGGVLNVRALLRVGVHDDLFLPSSSTTATTFFNHHDSQSLRDTANTSHEVRGSGWRALHTAHRSVDRDALRSARSSACWLLFSLHTAHGELFGQCVQHSPLLHHLATSFSAVPEPTVRTASSGGSVYGSGAYGFDFECGSVTAQAELLSLLISSEAATTGSNSTNPDVTTGALHAYVSQNEAVPGNLLKKIILVLLSVRDIHTTSGGRDVSRRQTQLHCISACTRLLAVMLSVDHWRQHLGLGSSSGGTGSEVGGMSGPCAYLVELLLSLRQSLSALNATTTTSDGDSSVDNSAEALVLRLDLTLALILQHSAESKELFLQHSLRGESSGSGGGRSEVCVFKQHIDTISSAVANLNTPPTTTSATVGHNVSGGRSVVGSTVGGAGRGGSVVTPEVKRSLQSLKAKSTTSPSVSTSVKRGGAGGVAVGQSTSTWATRSTTATTANNQSSSKWREKSRGYVWNQDRHTPSSTPHHPSAATPGSAAVELPDGVKRRLWAAMTVLAQALSGCGEAVDWAIELQLHQSLSRLLRFAARYSLGALVTSTTAYTTSYTTHSPEDARWTPSNGMLASAVYALSCAFTHRHPHAKQCLAATGDATAAVLNPSTPASNTNTNTNNGGTALHQLVAVGLSRSIVPVARWVTLGLAGALLSSAKNAGSSTLKSTFSQIVALCLQRSLHASHADPEAVAPLLNTLTSFLASEEDLPHLSQLCRRDHTPTLRALQQSLGLLGDGAAGGKGGDGVSLGEFKLVTFQELLSWVQASHGGRAEVLVALCRCLGRVSICDRSHRAVGNLLSETMLALLCEAYSSSAHSLVSGVSALSLWHVVHHSEKAKGVVREILAASPGINKDQHVSDKENEEVCGVSDENGVDADGSQKAKYVLDSLRGLV